MGGHDLKTLKISVVASLAATLAWWPLRLPQRLWPEHPIIADFLLTLALTVLLQFAWPDSKSAKESAEEPAQKPLEKMPAGKTR